MTNEHTSLEKYTSHTLFEMVAKGLWVRGELDTEQIATYWPPVPLSLAALLSRSAGLLNRGSWGPIALCLVLVLSIASYLQLDWLQLTEPVCGTGLYKAHLLLVGINICTQFNPSTVKFIPWYLRPDAPVNYTGAFLYLTAWPGRRSICYTILLEGHVFQRRMTKVCILNSKSNECLDFFVALSVSMWMKK